MSDVLFGYITALTPINLIAAVISVASCNGSCLINSYYIRNRSFNRINYSCRRLLWAIFGGSISVILIRTPGTPAAAATAIDGYELTKQGKAGTAITASFISGILSGIPLYLFAPRLALLFGPAEYFWLSIFGLTIIAGASTKSIVKGLISGALGLMLSTVSYVRKCSFHIWSSYITFRNTFYCLLL